MLLRAFWTASKSWRCFRERRLRSGHTSRILLRLLLFSSPSFLTSQVMGRYEALPADRLLSYLPARLGFATQEGDAWQREGTVCLSSVHFLPNPVPFESWRHSPPSAPAQKPLQSFRQVLGASRRESCNCYGQRLEDGGREGGKREKSRKNASIGAWRGPRTVVCHAQYCT